MSSAVVSTSAALGRRFIFDDDAEPEVGSVSAHVETAAQACPERSRRGCPGEPSSTVNHAVHLQPGVARHDSRGRLSPHELQSTISNQKFSLASVTPASRLEMRPAPEMVSSGISALDALTGGLPRGCLTEICGSASSGRTTVLLAALAAATHRGEYCAVIDASDALDPHSAAAAGVDLDRLLWVRCGENSAGQSKQSVGAPRTSEHRLEQVLRATDLLLDSGGFGLIVLDLADLPPQDARRIPLTSWFRFRRAIEHKPTILLAIEQHPIAGSCSSLLLQLGSQRNSGEEHSVITMPGQQANSSREAATFISPAHKCREGSRKNIESRRGGTVPDTDDTMNAPRAHPTHTHLLDGLNIRAELIRSRLDRKPARSITFETKTAWAG